MDTMKSYRKLLLPLFVIALAALAWGQSAKPAPAPKGSGSQFPATSSAAAPAPPVDINSASMGELKSIPGIGDAYANKIMGGRPYKTKAQLKSRNILPEAVYEKVKDRIVAKQK
jgi:DNA uptake protein ComE-like DNA-binding protein